MPAGFHRHKSLVIFHNSNQFLSTLPFTLGSPVYFRLPKGIRQTYSRLSTFFFFHTLFSGLESAIDHVQKPNHVSAYQVCEYVRVLNTANYFRI